MSKQFSSYKTNVNLLFRGRPTHRVFCIGIFPVVVNRTRQFIFVWVPDPSPVLVSRWTTAITSLAVPLYLAVPGLVRAVFEQF